MKRSRFEEAIKEVTLLEEQAGDGANRLNTLPALFKVLLTLWYVSLTVSFDKYNISGLLSMGIYPLVIFLVYDIPFFRCIRRIKVILPFLLVAGALNPFFDKSTLAVVGNIRISGGMVSLVTLILKGFFAVLAGYLLIVSTGIEKICGALQKIHVPSILVTIILLVYRYVFLLLQETNKVVQAYSLRAPGQKGISIKAWGSLIGLLILRSMDRAESIYESMCLRGFGDGGSTFLYAVEQKAGLRDFLWFISWAVIMLLLRQAPVFVIVGNLLTSI